MTTQVLRMKEGISDTSYVQCSFIQNHVLSLTNCIKREAMRDFFLKHHPTTLCIADLDCASAGANTLDVISELIQMVEMTRSELNLECVRGPKKQDYQVYLNDLPGNDFNTLFASVTSFRNDLKKKMGVDFGNCLVNGVPGSFYERLFPNNSLHFVHSSYSLMWLSQNPEGIEDNKTNIYIAKTSPPNVCKAYYDQFEKDFSSFLHCRSKEVVAQGRMVLTILGRNTIEHYSKESSYMWDILATSLNHLLSEGYIEEEKLKTFNIPQYPPSPKELEYLVKKEGSFNINEVCVSKVGWSINEESSKTCIATYDFVRCMRSVAEPLLISHFGEGVVDKVFRKYADIVRVSMAKEYHSFINVTVSLTRK